MKYQKMQNFDILTHNIIKYHKNMQNLTFQITNNFSFDWKHEKKFSDLILRKIISKVPTFHEKS
jgi:hypothetical protein